MPTVDPCLCGDPYCPRCFPQHIEEDEDDAYEKAKAEALSEEPSSSSPIER